MSYKKLKLNGCYDIVNGSLIRSSYTTYLVLDDEKILSMVVLKDTGIKLITNLDCVIYKLNNIIANKEYTEEQIPFPDSIIKYGEEVDIHFICYYSVSHFGLNKIHYLYIDDNGRYWYRILDILMETDSLDLYEVVKPKLNNELHLA